MSFQSAHFFLFLVLVVTLNWLLRDRAPWRKSLLLAASYYFYMAWDWRFAALLVVLTAINYFAGRGIARASDERVRRLCLAGALTGSLGILAFFKYADFFIDELQHLLTAIGVAGDGTTLRIVLPIGISFFTFQSLSYVLDVFRRQEEECRNLLDFSVFVAFFPTVLAGPITRARFLLPQLARCAAPERADMDQGLALIVRGLVKKVVFADVLAAQLVGPAFADPGSYSSLFLLIALYAYTFQIYMDVSGYTDIARGAAQLCGFKLPENFDRPYIAATVSNFWQRWHISMSSFFRDYLYFGLGGSQRGNVYLNLMLTFLAIGMWHGAGWNFALYGLIHGAVVCVERWRRTRRLQQGLLPTVDQGLGWFAGLFVTFHIIVFSRVLFRAPDLGSAAAYMKQIFTSASTALPIGWHGISVLVAAAVLHWFLPQAGARALALFTRLPVLAQGLALVSTFYLLLVLSVGTAPFVYFQF
jgi:D-alanyl-lipoteichoic acid acyltransferase DltB (MBOAT superfamily)